METTVKQYVFNTELIFNRINTFLDNLDPSAPFAIFCKINLWRGEESVTDLQKAKGALGSRLSSKVAF